MLNIQNQKKKFALDKLLIVLAIICVIFALVLVVGLCLNNAEISIFGKSGEELEKLQNGMTANSTVSSENKYYINTAQELWDFAEEVNSGNTFEGVIVYLTGDIDLECSEEKQWIPIGDYNSNSVNQFKGIFDAQGHSISGIYINTDKKYQGLFGYNAGTIKSLTINEGNITSSGSCTGVVVGYNTGKIIDVINEAIITGGDNLGGICGRNYGDIISCQNNGIIIGLEVVTGKQLGGITGFNGGNIKRSNNTGTINGNESEGLLSGVGGIVGYNEGKIEDCNNSANINNLGNTGGIAGLNSTRGAIINCSNTGEIIGKMNLGGIAGDNVYGSSREGYTIILNCSNSGNIKSTLTTGTSYVGGIVGSSSSASKKGRTVISKCKNTGLVEGSVYAGGICGFQGDGSGGDTSYIKKCWNSGTVKSYVYGTETTAITYSDTGGIVGYNNCGYIDECYNTGEIWGAIDAGGIVAMNSGIIMNSYNLGNVNAIIDIENSSDYQLSRRSTSSAAGIVVDNSDTIKNCYNAGKVVADYASGLVSSNGSNAILENCYTVGNIEAIKSIRITNSRNNK